MLFITKGNLSQPKKGVYNEKNIIFILHMFYHFAFAGCSPSKKDSAEATNNTGNCKQQLPLQKIPLILLPLIQMPRMILMIFQLIKKNQKTH